MEYIRVKAYKTNARARQFSFGLPKKLGEERAPVASQRLTVHYKSWTTRPLISAEFLPRAGHLLAPKQL